LAEAWSEEAIAIASSARTVNREWRLERAWLRGEVAENSTV
jgi:hypothetical protein